MFERFTDRARKVVVLAQEEARMLNHKTIGTEHILLGLIHEGEGVAAKALESLGISLEAVRQQVEEIIGLGQEAQSGHIPFTPRAKKVLEFTLQEALQLGHNYIGTEHILLGLIREGEGVAAQVLVKLGADLSRVRQQVIQLLSGHAARGELETASTSPRADQEEEPEEETEKQEALPRFPQAMVVDLLRAGELMRAVTLEALLDLWRGDLDRLESHLGAAVRLAALSGDTRQLLALRQIVEIRDAEKGDVRLKPRPPEATP
jgi:ATP-dependent Clp protease ATP-binding subunit ClpA